MSSACMTPTYRRGGGAHHEFIAGAVRFAALDASRVVSPPAPLHTLTPNPSPLMWRGGWRQCRFTHPHQSRSLANEPVPSRKYSDREIALILKRAAEKQEE